MQHLELIEKNIRRHKFGRQPKQLYEPIHYIMSLGGKRLRPSLVLLAYSLYKTDTEKVVSYACAVEAFHNFTLMHDDIMDRAPLRRGKPTVHEKWNVNTAILAGDVMLVKVYDMFLSLPGDTLKEVLRIFNQCAAEVCEGQQWDMAFESRDKVSEREYLEMIRLKTAVLLGLSLELGAVLAGASGQDRQALREFGTNIGIAFQLKDDLLDVYANKKEFGKQTGGDIIANKKTFLLIKALQLARGKDKKELQRWLASRKFKKKEKVKAVTAIYDKVNIKLQAEKKIEHFFQRAFTSLEALSAKDKTPQLITFAKELALRQK